VIRKKKFPKYRKLLGVAWADLKEADTRSEGQIIKSQKNTKKRKNTLYTLMLVLNSHDSSIKGKGKCTFIFYSKGAEPI